VRRGLPLWCGVVHGPLLHGVGDGVRNGVVARSDMVCSTACATMSCTLDKMKPERCVHGRQREGVWGVRREEQR
jgi:hypothetical protein